MNEAEIIQIVNSALSDLKELKLDVHDIKQIFINDHTAEVQILDDSGLTPADDVTPQVLSDSPSDTFQTDILAFSWCNTALLVSILCVLLVSLGVQLWHAFSDKWRV